MKEKTKSEKAIEWMKELDKAYNKEKTLSDEIYGTLLMKENRYVFIKDLKHFIKRLKGEIKCNPNIQLKNDEHYTNILNMIDKIFGDKLI